jgi:hypothetical protein
MKIFLKKYFPFLIGGAFLALLILLNIKPNYLPTGDQILLEYMGKQAHNNYWPENINGYVSNQIYVFSELIYYLDFLFTSAFVKYLFLFILILASTYTVLYYIFWKITKGDKVFSALAPLPFLIARFAVGGEFWGMTNISLVQGRSFYMPFFFLIYYFTFLAIEKKSGKNIFIMGLLSALSFFAYPGGGFYIPLILSLTLLLYAVLRRLQFRHIVSYVSGCIIGYIPTVLNTLFNKDARIDGILTQYFANKDIFDVVRFNEIVLTRLPHIFGKGWTRMVAELLFLFLVLGFILWRYKKTQPVASASEDTTQSKNFIFFSAIFFVSTAVVTFGIPLVQKILVETLDWPYFFFEQLRSSRYLFPPLLFILSVYLYFLYKRKAYRLVLLVFVLSLFSFRFFQPLINNALYKTLPQDFRTKYGLARTNAFESSSFILSQSGTIRETAIFMRDTVDPKSKVFVVADDDLHFSFRNTSELSTNNMWKELSLFIIQRPLEADRVMKDVLDVTSFMYKDTLRLKEAVSNGHFTHIVIARISVTEEYLQNLETKNLDILKVEKIFTNDGFIVYKVVL